MPYTTADRMYITNLKVVPGRCGPCFVVGGEMAVHVVGWEATPTVLHSDRLIQVAGVHQLDTSTVTIRSVIIQNDPDSANSVYIGNDVQQFLELSPAATLIIPIDQLAKVYVSFADGAATVNYLAAG